MSIQQKFWELSKRILATVLVQSVLFQTCMMKLFLKASFRCLDKQERDQWMSLLPVTENQKKFTVPVDRSIISDSSIGLTISTNKNEIVKIIQDQYNIYKAKKDSIAKCDEEMKRCQDLLDKLDIKPEEKEDPRIKELQNEVSELKNIIKQASHMVPAPMKQMLPQDMQNAMNEASH